MISTQDLFAENLRKIRKNKGLTQEALAEKLNLSLQAVQNWENCRTFPVPDNLDRLSEALDVPVWDFFRSPMASSEASDKTDVILRLNRRIFQMEDEHAQARKELLELRSLTEGIPVDLLRGLKRATPAERKIIGDILADQDSATSSQSLLPSLPRKS